VREQPASNFHPIRVLGPEECDFRCLLQRATEATSQLHERRSVFLDLSAKITFGFEFLVHERAFGRGVTKALPHLKGHIRVNIVATPLENDVSFTGLLVIANLVDALRIDIDHFHLFSPSLAAANFAARRRTSSG
jgi:hypothetical protein